MELELKSYKSLKENRDLRIQAMAMYLSGQFYPTEIAERLHVDINELGLYVFGKNKQGTNKNCWKYLLDNGEAPRYIEVYEKIKPLYIKKTEKKLLDAINKVVDNITNDEDKMLDMDTKDLSNLIASYEKVDKIGRLEDGRATNHTINERTSFSLRDIVRNKNVVEVKDDDYSVRDTQGDNKKGFSIEDAVVVDKESEEIKESK